MTSEICDTWFRAYGRDGRLMLAARLSDVVAIARVNEVLSIYMSSGAHFNLHEIGDDDLLTVHSIVGGGKNDL